MLNYVHALDLDSSNEMAVPFHGSETVHLFLFFFFFFYFEVIFKNYFEYQDKLMDFYY